MSINKGTFCNCKGKKRGSSLCTDKEWTPLHTAQGRTQCLKQHSGWPLYKNDGAGGTGV